MLDMARTLDAAIAELAARQHSVFSRVQALQVGFTVKQIKHRLATGRWRRVRQGVYALAGSTPSFEQEVMAATLWAGDGAVASHRTAAELYRIDGIRSRKPIHITVPRGRFPQAPGIVTHRTSLLGPGDTATVHGIPATAPTRILLDSGLIVPKNVLELGLEDVLRRGYASEAWILRRLERLGGTHRQTARPLVEVLTERDPNCAPLESVLEYEAWNLLAQSRHPRPVRQFPVKYRGQEMRIDFAYVDQMLAVEADGFRWHSGRLKWGIDRRRAAMLAALGWRIFPITWGDIQLDPLGTLAMLDEALLTAA